MSTRYLQRRRQAGRTDSADLPNDADDPRRLAALNRVLFEEQGFHGSRTDYYESVEQLSE